MQKKFEKKMVPFVIFGTVLLATVLTGCQSVPPPKAHQDFQKLADNRSFIKAAEACSETTDLTEYEKDLCDNLFAQRELRSHPELQLRWIGRHSKNADQAAVEVLSVFANTNKEIDTRIPGHLLMTLRSSALGRRVLETMENGSPPTPNCSFERAEDLRNISTRLIRKLRSHEEISVEEMSRLRSVFNLAYREDGEAHRKVRMMEPLSKTKRGIAEYVLLLIPVHDGRPETTTCFNNFYRSK